MTKAFDPVNIHQLIQKIHNTHIPTTISKFLANYLKGRRQYTSYNNHTFKHTNIKAGVPQGGVLSPTLFNIYLSGIPLPKINSLNLITYADDITITSSHPNINTATQNLLPYHNEIHTWAHNNNLQINPTKTTSTLITPDPLEYNKPLNIHINNTPILTTSNPTILGLTFDPKLNSPPTQTTQSQKQKNTQYLRTFHINTLEKKQRNTHHHIQNITPSHHRIRQHHLVTHHLIHLPQQTPKSSKRSLENNHWLHPRHQHPTPPLRDHLKLHASQLIQKASHPTHPLHPLTTQGAHPRYKKQSNSTTTSTTS